MMFLKEKYVSLTNINIQYESSNECKILYCLCLQIAFSITQCIATYLNKLMHHVFLPLKVRFHLVDKERVMWMIQMSMGVYTTAR